jgi:hypothetical protein|tara:strand:- start:867 stop:1994 length:1128 start_codon:yes stop_codon:yes gene_type:complete
MNIDNAINLTVKEKEKKEKKKIYMKKYRNEKKKIEKNNNINNDNKINKDLYINNNIIEITPYYEKKGNKNLTINTLNNYINKIKKIHLNITNKNLDINIIKNILNNENNNETNNNYIINELYYLENNILVDYLFNTYKNIITIKSYLIPFVVLTSYIKYYKESNIYNNLSNIVINIGKEYEKNIDDNNLNDKDINKLINNYDIKYILNNINKINIIDDKLIYGLYTLLPPRRLEYSNMIVTNKNNLDDLDNNFNYLIFNNNEKYFVFNNYKTYKLFGQQKILIPYELVKLLNEYIVYNNIKSGDKLFNISTNTFGKKIKQIFKKIYNENITLRWLRISYTTYIRKNNLTNNELKEISYKMAHSLITNSRYNKIIK